MINYHKACVDHRGEGLRMWSDGSHPERKTTPPTPSRPASKSQPSQATSSPPKERKRQKIPAIVWIIIGIMIWGFLSDQFGNENQATQGAINTPSIERNSGSIDLSQYSTGSGSCGAESYRNVDGDCISGPVHAPSAPPGATARCRDGTYSFSQNRRGTCSHHGGVASWGP